MKLAQLVENAPAHLAELEITDITNNSKRVCPGALFVCIAGAAADGHDYAAAAAQAGAAAVLAQRDVGLENQILVGDTRIAYAKACAAFFGHPADRLSLIGVTGTNGKTTVAFLLKSVLEQLGERVGLIGTIQNMIGQEAIPAVNTTPDAYELHSLLRRMADAGCTRVVMEVSSHALDQERVFGLTYDRAVFTNLTQDHLDYHKTMENYLAAKQRLFHMCGTAVINIDDPHAAQMTQGTDCEIITFSAISDAADYTAKGISHRADGVKFELVSTGSIGRVRFGTPGAFSVYNALAAGACAASLGYPVAEVAAALSRTPGVKGRAEVVPTDRDFTVIIDYAHTPDWLKNILETLGEVKEGRLVTVFGCGGDRDKTKRPLMGKIAAELSDFVVVTSDNPRSEDPAAIIRDILVGMEGTQTPYTVVENREEAIRFAIKSAQPHDIIVLAGKGHETYQVTGSGTIHFDEREIVAQALQDFSIQDAR